MEYKSKILKSFPKSLESNIISLLQKVSFVSEFDFEEFGDYFSVSFQSEKLQIPYRIYFQEINSVNLNETESVILNCLFTRHHNGFVRQKSLEKIISSDVSFITPFVFQLLGEYVLQIIEVINNNLTETIVQNMRSFALENPDYLHVTENRMTSYWNYYTRLRE